MTPTHFTPGRLKRLLSSGLLTLALLLAACATPGGFSSPSAPASASEATLPVDTVRADSTAATGPAVTPTARAPGDAAMLPVPVPVDPLRPDVRLNLDDRSAQTDLWARVRQGFAMPDLDMSTRQSPT